MESQEDLGVGCGLSQPQRLDISSGTLELCGGEDDDDEVGEAAAALQRWALRLDHRVNPRSPAASVLHVCDEEEEDEEEQKHRRRAVSLPSNPSLAAASLFRPYAGGAGAEGCCKCKKRVQFADALGLTLASVHHFSALEEPQVPPAVLSRLHSFPAGQRDLNTLLLMGGGLNQEGNAIAPPPAFLEPDFEALSEEEQQERLRHHRVCLERVNAEHFDVRGCVRIAPRLREEGDAAVEGEQVSVRYTFNEWLSYLDTPAEREGPPGSLRYRFTLCAPPCLEPDVRLHFAVCYREAPGGCEHWDNNEGINYILRYRPPQPT